MAIEALYPVLFRKCFTECLILWHPSLELLLKESFIKLGTETCSRDHMESCSKEKQIIKAQCYLVA